MTLRWKAGCTILRWRAPVLAFARHEAVAEEDGDALDADALGEVGVVVDQHVAHVIGMRQDPQVAVERGRVSAKRVAVAMEFLHQRGERVGLERDVERRLRARRFEYRERIARASICYCRRFARVAYGSRCKRIARNGL